MSDYRKEIEEILKDLAEEPDDVGEVDTFTTYRAAVLINKLLALISKSQKDLIKKLDDEMLERILYIGEAVPEYFTTDYRTKFILLGYPQELLDSLKGEKDHSFVDPNMKVTVTYRGESGDK